MMKQNRKITLYKQLIYEVRIPGEVKQEWFNQNIVDVQYIEGPEPESVFRIKVDQAGLIGFLRLLYTRGIPLLGVNIVETTMSPIPLRRK